MLKKIIVGIFPACALFAASSALAFQEGPVNQQPPPPETQPTEEEVTPAQSDEPVEGAVIDAEDLSELSLEELLNITVVVTASRREQKINSVPYAISVITAEDIRAAGARSIPDALRLVPGVDVADLTFGNSAVSPRGLHGFLASQTLVLVDGRQIFDAINGGTLWGAWPFMMEDVERIEVIRGPGGVTWGANAVNGVINIITKDPADQLGTTVSSSGGSRGTFKQYLGHAFRDGNLRLRLSMEYEASDGFGEGISILARPDDDYKSGRINLYGVYEISADETLNFSIGSGVVDGGISVGPMFGIGLSTHPGAQASYLQGTWAREVEEGNRFEVTGYINDFYFGTDTKAVDFRYQQIALQFRHTLMPSTDRTITWGLDSRVDLVDGTNADPFMFSRGRVNSAILGLYFQEEVQLADEWVLNFGGRVEYDSYGGFEPSGRISLAYVPDDDCIIYAAIARAFAMPPAASRFLHTPLLNGLAVLSADSDIDAQSLVAYEIGYRGRLFDRLDLSLQLYWHEFDDLLTISPQLGFPTLLSMSFDNRAQASMYGVELETRYAVSEDLTLLGNYTYEQMDWSSSAPFHERDNISPPRHKFMIGARYSPTDDLHLSGNLFYVDAVESPNAVFPLSAISVDSYLRLDLRAEYEFRNDEAFFAIGVRNLLDDGHSEGGSVFLDGAETPRMVFAELRLRIN